MKTRRTNQRINYFDGQLLRADDLQADSGYEAWLRGMHVRAVHQTWGIALGFELTLVGGQVRIAPGIAYDCHGREIMSARPITVAAPQLPEGPAPGHYFDLVISYDEGLAAEPAGATLCFEPGRPPFEEGPLWRWRYAGPMAFALAPAPTDHGSVRLGEEIPLGRFLLTRRAGLGEPDGSVRRSVQAQVRPYIANGQAQLTPIFNYWYGNYFLTIDTSAAGFNQTPYYFAGLSSHPLIGSRTNFTIEEAATIRNTFGPFLSIRDADRDGFTLDVRFANPLVGSTGSGSYASLLAEQFSVKWVGIEMTRGCPAPPTYFVFLPLFVTAEAVLIVNEEER